jgi:hypothetical protein
MTHRFELSWQKSIKDNTSESSATQYNIPKCMPSAASELLNVSQNGNQPYM